MEHYDQNVIVNQSADWCDDPYPLANRRLASLKERQGERIATSGVALPAMTEVVDRLKNMEG